MADLRKQFVTSNLELGFEGPADKLVGKIGKLDFVTSKQR